MRAYRPKKCGFVVGILVFIGGLADDFGDVGVAAVHIREKVVTIDVPNPPQIGIYPLQIKTQKVQLGIPTRIAENGMVGSIVRQVESHQNTRRARVV